MRIVAVEQGTHEWLEWRRSELLKEQRKEDDDATD